MGLGALLPLLMLLMVHHSRNQGANQTRPQQPHQPQGQNPPLIGGGTPAQQGVHGKSQGFHGSLAPILGGLGSMQNTVGQHEHQTAPFNPLSFLASVQ